MALPRLIILTIFFVTQISYAENAPMSEAESFVHDFPELVLANCDLVRLACGNERLEMKEHTHTWGGQEQTYTTFQGHGIQIRTSDGVDHIDIRNRGFPIPHGLNVGETRQKVREKLGKLDTFSLDERPRCMTYKNLEKGSELMFCFDNERITQILWSQYRGP